MYRQKLLKFNNGDQPTNNFRTDFNPPLIIPEDSLIAMQSFSMELLPESIVIDSTNDTYAYAFAQSTAKTYNEQKKLHTIKVKHGTYNSSSFANILNSLLNSRLFYVADTYYREQGAEILVNISEDKKMSISCAVSQLSDYKSPYVDAVNYDTNNYTYTNDPGSLDRIGDNIDSFTKNDFFITNNIFSRGSGVLSCYDNESTYIYTGNFVDGGDDNVIFITDDVMTLE